MIHKTAIIDSNAKISENVTIGPYSVQAVGNETVFVTGNSIAATSTLGNESVLLAPNVFPSGIAIDAVLGDETAKTGVIAKPRQNQNFSVKVSSNAGSGNKYYVDGSLSMPTTLHSGLLMCLIKQILQTVVIL